MSYAAVAITRSVFRKCADFTAAMAFEMASTNMVAELGMIMAILVGSQFTVAEFVGAPIMVFMLVFLLTKQKAERRVPGVMEGHAEMDMAVSEGPLLQRILSVKSWTAISHYFVIEQHGDPYLTQETWVK